MFIVITFIFMGIIAGCIMRKKESHWLSKVTTGFVWILLFLMGVEVGGNEHIMQSLPTLGVEALCLSAFATAGSCVGAWVQWKLINKKKGMAK